MTQFQHNERLDALKTVLLFFFHKAQAEFYIKGLMQVVSAVKETLLKRGESFNTPEKADPNLPCPSFSSVCDTLSHTQQGRA